MEFRTYNNNDTYNIDLNSNFMNALNNYDGIYSGTNNNENYLRIPSDSNLFTEEFRSSKKLYSQLTSKEKKTVRCDQLKKFLMD